jgi:hypothetical protein
MAGEQGGAATMAGVQGVAAGEQVLFLLFIDVIS